MPGRAAAARLWPRPIGRRDLLAAALLMAFSARSEAAKMDERFKAGVAVSAEDIAWFRSCRSLWVDSESGAPAIFGPGLSPETIGTISAADYAAFETRLEPILCAFFLHVPFEPGTYRLASAPAGMTQVEVTADDITLLRRTSWRHFAIDGKRPYGDFTNFPIDMAQALGIPVTINAEGYAALAPDAEARMLALHEKSQFVLQAYIEHARLEPGHWFVPYDGWSLLVSPRCRPLKAAAIAAYHAAMAGIAARAAVEDPTKLVVPRLQVAAALLASD